MLSKIAVVVVALSIFASPTVSSADELEKAKELNKKLVQLYQQGKYAEAAKIGKHVLVIREKLLGPDHPDTATSLNNLAFFYDKMGQYADAKPLYKRSLAIRENSLGPNHPATATSLNNLALLYESVNQYADAEPLLKRSLAIWDKTLGPDHPKTADTLHNLAGLYESMGRYADAEPLYKRSLEISQKSLDPDHPSTALSLNNLAKLYISMGRYADAEPLYKRSLDIWEKSLGPNHPSTATSLGNLATCYSSMGRYDDAELLHKRSLAIREKTHGPDHPDTANSLNNLGSLYIYMGRHDEAEPLIKRSLAIREKSLGPDHPDTAESLNNLAGLYYSMGRYADAEPLYKRSLEIRERYLGPGHLSTANSLDNLAGLYKFMVRYADAGKLYERSLAIKEKALGLNHPSTALSLNNLAEFYKSMGRYADAEPLYKRSLDIWEKSLGLNHPDTATSLGNLAALYYSMGRYSDAEPLMKRSLAIRENSLGPNHPDTATSLNNKGWFYYSLGRYADAEPLLKRALTIWKKSLGPNHPSTSFSLNNLALFMGTTGDTKESLRLFQRGNKAQNRIVETVFRVSTEKEILAFVEYSSWGYMGALSLVHSKLSTNQSALQTALELVLVRKGIVFNAQARQSEALTNSLNSSVRGLWKELSSKRFTFAKILRDKPKNLSAEQYKQILSNLQSDIGKLEGELASKSALMAEELAQRGVTTERLTKRLPSGGVLAEFVKIDDYDWDKGKWADTHRYLAFILHSDERIELIDLGDAEQLESGVTPLLAKLKTLPTSEQEAKVQIDVVRDLGKLVYEPIGKAVGDSTNVIFSPDGILNLVPFNALADDSGKFLTERKTITYVTSGRDLMKSANIKPESDLVLAANPTYDVAANATETESSKYRGSTRSRNFAIKFDPLPGTALEAKTIPGMLKGKKKSVLTGAKATEKSVRSAYRPRVLHLATHGFFLEDRPEIAMKDTMRIGNMFSLPRGYENPLVRSGLAFAGANNANEAETSLDGLLTALEVTAMDLHGTDLVTLSACETAVGDVKTGEGVYGLRRSFALAGARNLLMSLWPVADKITAEQMETFYRLYGQGKTPSDSLRQAQLETIAQLREKFGVAPPSLWAPFILQGVPSEN